MLHTLQYITRTEKRRTTIYINDENVSGDQRRLGFRDGHCHVQLTGIVIYIKLQERIKDRRLLSLTFLCKNNRK